MRYLIDTNILIRLRMDTSSISKDVFQIIEDMENRIHISAVSIQEIFSLLQTSKIDIKKWKDAQDVFDFIEKELGFIINYVKREHLQTYAELEQVKDHSDPFDRMIVAQAITEKMPLISSDTKMKHYRKQQLDLIYNGK